MLKMNHVVIVLLLSLTVTYSGSDVRADGPVALIKGLFGSSGGKVSADASADYPLDETNGPWMIYVKCYDGPTAREDARALALELRQKHALKAYVYHRQFDHTKGFEEEEQRKRMEMQIRQSLANSEWGDMPLNMPRTTKVTTFLNGGQSEEYAVLVGDFQSINDKDINKAFEKIKNLEPACIIAQWNRDIAAAGETGKFSKTVSIEVDRQFIRNYNQNAVRPLGNAKKCPNPVLPDGYVGNKVDDFVLEMNKDSRYSLLRCPGKYTMKVGEFRGTIISDPQQIEKIERDESLLVASSQLVKAGDKAEDLCEALRMKNYEAYTFHGRTSSIVTVGSFDTLGRTDRNGDVVEYHPEIVNIYATFAWDPQKDKVVQQKLAPGETLQAARSLIGIPFLQTPEPMEVPKTYIRF